MLLLLVLMIAEAIGTQPNIVLMVADDLGTLSFIIGLSSFRKLKGGKQIS